LTVKVPFAFISFTLFDSDIDIAKFPNNFRPWTSPWVGVDSVWEQEKLEARKILENAAESHTSGARFVGQRSYSAPNTTSG
jgi:hypothetical protein